MANVLTFKASSPATLKNLKLGLYSVDAGDQLATMPGTCDLVGVTVSGEHKNTTSETLTIELDDGTTIEKDFPAGHIIIFDLDVAPGVDEQVTTLDFSYTTVNGEALRVHIDLHISPSLASG